MSTESERPWQAHGGPAFPVAIEGLGQFKGLSAREWFAGQAIAGFVGDAMGIDDVSHIATAAYRLADAMIAAGESK